MNRSKLAPMLPLLLLAGCAGSMPAVAPHAPAPSVSSAAPPVAPADPEAFRTNAPAPGAMRPFTLPAVEEARLPNGMRVLVARRSDIPLVGVRILTDHGAAHAAPGLAYFASSMVEGGTKRHDATALAEAWDQLGGSHGSYASYDAFTFSFDVLAPRLPEAMSLAAEALRTSTFPEAEVERARRRHLAALAQRQDEPDALSADAVRSTLFGAGHAFAAPIEGTVEGLRAFRSSDVKGFFRDHVQPNRMTIAFGGATTLEEAKALTEKAFGDWRGTAPAPEPGAMPDQPSGTQARVILVDKPALSQSTVAITDLGMTRSHPEVMAIRVMASILGGTFSSRINLNLREAHEYTYGAFAMFDMERTVGTFQASSAVIGDKTAPAIVEIRKEIDRLREGGATDDELAAAKIQIARSAAERFQTADGAAAALAGLAELGLPKDEYTTWPERLAAVTKDDVLRAARTYLRPASMRVVVVGDAKAVGGDLANLGLGPVELRSAAHPTEARKP